jgi:hypothetical protein
MGFVVDRADGGDHVAVVRQRVEHAGGDRYGAMRRSGFTTCTRNAGAGDDGEAALAASSVLAMPDMAPMFQARSCLHATLLLRRAMLGFGRFATALATRATQHMDVQVPWAQDAQERPPSLRSVAALTASLPKDRRRHERNTAPAFDSGAITVLLCALALREL